MVKSLTGDTKARIEALRVSAGAAGDQVQVAYCDLALSGCLESFEERPDEALLVRVAGMSQESAVAECLGVCRETEIRAIDERAWCASAEAGDYLAEYWEGERDPGSRCGWSDSALADIRRRLSRRGLTLTADDRGLVVRAVEVQS